MESRARRTRNKTLETLDLRCNFISTESGPTLAGMIRDSSSLTTLLLGGPAALSSVCKLCIFVVFTGYVGVRKYCFRSVWTLVFTNMSQGVLRWSRVITGVQ